MTVLHSALTTTDLHEPKGVSTATSGQVYVADGAGSGAWTTQSSATFTGVASGAILRGDGANSYTSTTAWPDPNGITADYVFQADGANNGAWVAPQTLAPVMLNAVIADVSTAETVYIPIPYAGTITKVISVLGGAITVADATITVSNSAAASMGTLTVAYTSSAAGDVDTLAPGSNNTVTADDYITIATDGGSTGAQKLWLTVVLERT